MALKKSEQRLVLLRGLQVFLAVLALWHTIEAKPVTVGGTGYVMPRGVKPKVALETAQVDHRFGKWYEGRSIGHLNSPPSGSFFVDDVLSECSLGSCRGIVQGDYRRNELLRGLEFAKGLNQSLSVNSVEGLFEVKAKYSPTDAEVVLCTGFNPRAQCESTRGRFINDVIVFAHPGVDPGKRICDVSLRKIGKLRHPCKLGPNMLEEAIADDGRKGFRFWAHQANRSKSSRIGWRFSRLWEPHYPRIGPLFREDSVRGGMLCKGLLKQGRNKAIMLFLFGGELAIVIFKENPVAGCPRGQFFDHLIDFALVALLGSILCELEEVQNFLAFFRMAGFRSFLGFQVVTDCSPPRSEQAPRAFGLDRRVPSLLPKPPEMLDHFVLPGRWLFNSGEGFLTGLKKDPIKVNFALRGALNTLLNPFGNRVPQLLCPWILATRRSV
ncbi:hypothetical protein AK812_SmicGene38482 [Symbiodinium microadriaticum]|uniref:Uncharacterized protein n=1 Tax=Symbiodinium microadriaticum TaxID=2951 RepID=A0A1Q9CDN2_SYMMI|nr:hypothetical protein AK812_SmicGene38482 [Symbiodinium microadriaticum]